MALNTLQSFWLKLTAYNMYKHKSGAEKRKDKKGKIFYKISKLESFFQGRNPQSERQRRELSVTGPSAIHPEYVQKYSLIPC